MQPHPTCNKENQPLLLYKMRTTDTVLPVPGQFYTFSSVLYLIPAYCYSIFFLQNSKKFNILSGHSEITTYMT